MGDNYASLAASTATAIETASKHNLQCRVSTDHIIQWVQDSVTNGESAVTIVMKDKMKYCMHKNDIVVGVRQGWFPDSIAVNKAYPQVISTYASMSEAAQYWLIRLYNNTKTMKDLNSILNEKLVHRGGPNADADGFSPLRHNEQQQINQMPQFYFMGVSLGVAYAHPDSGDTVGTVMYGGLRTVLNGPVGANTGQYVQWIFQCEAGCYGPDGKRIFANTKFPPVIEDGMAMIKGQVNNVISSMDMKTLDRKIWHGRENGNLPGYSGKDNIILLIPYVRPDEGPENILDRDRICGIYISSARPYEMVDIKFQRQAI